MKVPLNMVLFFFNYFYVPVTSPPFSLVLKKVEQTKDKLREKHWFSACFGMHVMYQSRTEKFLGIIPWVAAVLGKHVRRNRAGR